MTIAGQSQNKTIINGTGTYSIFHIKNGVNVTITNLTLNNATAYLGGAIENYCNLTLISCIFTDNKADGFGSAVYNDGNLTVTNCNFTNNKADGFGGAIYHYQGTISLNGCNFTNNNATSGGAIYHYQGTISLSGCNFTNNNATNAGGAITNQDTITILSGCTFTNNNATNAGGAIGNGGTISNLSGCTFNDNKANKGGAIYNSGTITSLINCKFNNNKATITYVYGGGAIYNKGTITSLSGCTFTNNRAAKYGGAVYNDATIISLSGCNFTGNIASSYGGGGAIFNYGTLTATSSTFTGNRGYNGGAINNQGNLTATGCTFTGNNAPIGGAIDNWRNATVIGSTFTGNTADSGGAISNDHGTLIAENCVFTGNTATGEGGAISNDGTMNPVTTTLKNCTFTGNTATDEGGAISSIVDMGSATINLTECSFQSNTADSGGAIYSSGTLTANYNRFYNNTALIGTAIYCSNGGSVDANYNWWSSNKDPKTIPNLIYDPGNLVNATYWVILSVNATPNNINNTQSATITADLNHYTNSTGYVGELSTHIPDGTITLNIPWGSFTSSGITHSITLNTIDNVVEAILYANEGAVNASYNPVKVTALADGYTTNDIESAYITINKVTKLYIKTTNNNNNPKVGETFTLTYKLGNYGPDAAENVTITFQIPEGLNFVNIRVDNGKYTYDSLTRTVTWTLDSVPVGDPYLYLTVKAADDGIYKITPKITSATYNLNSGDNGIISINIQPNNNSGNGTGTNTVNAVTKTTIGLQDTGLPLNYLILAILMVLGGLVPKRK